MPTKNKSCDLVQHGVAGPTADHILAAIRAEYWLPTGSQQHAPRGSNKAADAAPESMIDAQPAQPDTTNPSPQVKP